jgi:hypothetical protein
MERGYEGKNVPGWWYGVLKPYLLFDANIPPVQPICFQKNGSLRNLMYQGFSHFRKLDYKKNGFIFSKNDPKSAIFGSILEKNGQKTVIFGAEKFDLKNARIRCGSKEIRLLVENEVF